MSAGAAIPSLPVPQGDLEAALARRIDGFDFESGAVLIHIPQVPPARIEPRIARSHGYFAYPPQALFYLGAVFDTLGVANALVDLNYTVLRAAVEGRDPEADWRGAIDEAMAVHPGATAYISFMFDTTWPQMAAVVAHLKQNWPKACVAVGGVATTADPERVLRETGADLAFSNEGEGPLTAFFEFLRRQFPVDLHNLSFVDAGRTLWQAPIRTGGAVDFDIRPQFAKVPLADYHRIGSLNNFARTRGVDVAFATMLSRRGCRAKCTFCSVRNFNGKSVRVRRTDGVIDEFVHLHDTLGIRHFDWLDDDLLYDHDAALALFRNLAQRLPGITWAANNGLIAAALTPELLQALQESGCIGFSVGMETGNRELLRKVRKPATVEKFFAFAEMARNFPRMYYTVNFILGLPGETFGQMLDSFHVATRAALDWNNFFTYLPLKNTDAWVAYGGMDDGRTDEDVTARGTTMNFNPSRSVSLQADGAGSGLATGYDVFDLDATAIPNPEQLKEIWFTFNAIANFLKVPAASVENEDRIRNCIRWLEALRTAYEDNPSIDCTLSYLHRRLGADAASLDAMKQVARAKFERSPYWSWRDRQFGFSAMLDGEVPPLDSRALTWFGRPL